MAQHLFVYGTLMAPEVLQRVVGRTFPARPGRLAGFARFRVAGAHFPGVVAEAERSTDGLLYSDLDEAALTRIDRFESDFYRRETHSILLDSGDTEQACVYVVPPHNRRYLTEEPWDFEQFRKSEMRAFIGDEGLD